MMRTGIFRLVRGRWGSIRLRITIVRGRRICNTGTRRTLVELARKRIRDTTEDQVHQEQRLVTVAKEEANKQRIQRCAYLPINDTSKFIQLRSLTLSNSTSKAEA